MDRRKHTAERLAPSQGSPELQRLKLGEIDVDEYIELRLDVAIVRLGRLVSEDQRSLLRQLIREQCLTDPVVQEYVRRAMGRINP